MSDVVRDVWFAVRTLRRAPGFTLAALVTLSLGIGSTTAIFSTVNATLLRPLPYPGWHDLYSLRTRFTDGSLTSGLLAPIELARLNGPDLRAAATVRIDRTLLRPDGTPMPAVVYGVTEGFFDLFRLPVTLGRAFVRVENRVQGQPPIGVISYRLWRGAYGGDPAGAGWLVRSFTNLQHTDPGFKSQGRVLVATGALLGLAVAYAAGRLASSWLYEVQASDPMILGAALGLVLAIALIATVIPARRVAAMDPVRALRTE
jgi:hypothetical protein